MFASIRGRHAKGHGKFGGYVSGHGPLLHTTLRDQDGELTTSRTGKKKKGGSFDTIHQHDTSAINVFGTRPDGVPIRIDGSVYGYHSS